MFIDHVLFINRYQGRSKAFYIDAPIHHAQANMTLQVHPRKKVNSFRLSNLPNTISGFRLFKVCVFSIHFVKIILHP